MVLFWINGEAQSNAKNEVAATIKTFFEAFHAQDTTAMRALTATDMVLQTVAKDDQGEAVVRQQAFGDFLKGIAAIPKDRDYLETLLEVRIQIDGPLAQVWTPYVFYVNKAFSHCGANSFQLFKNRGKWEILYLIDTRHKEDCKL